MFFEKPAEGPQKPSDEAGNDRTRRFTTAVGQNLSSQVLKLAENQKDSRAGGGSCFGDSGGPDLLGGTSTVLGVNSYVTNWNCAGVGYSQRIDIPEVLDWINSFM